MECLVTNKVCSESNRKCKECKLDNCKEALKLIEEEEKMWVDKSKEKFQKWLKIECPVCVNCKFLEVESYKDLKCKCFYRFKNRCVIKSR
jgi:endonuclease YncB( thermonuclease family)